MPDNTYTLTAGDCREVLAAMSENIYDAVVTDPPYELAFMGKEWDRTGVSLDVETWKHVFRVLKPGGHMLCFGGTRTFHRIAVAIEDAGFEIRDCLSWLYSSGFPKSLDVSKAIDKSVAAVRPVIGSKQTRIPGGNTFAQDAWTLEHRSISVVDITAPATPEAEVWNGWGTALKPAWEPIILARKPLELKTVAQNVAAYGTGAINVDGCRIGTTGATTRSHQEPYGETGRMDQGGGQPWRTGHSVINVPAGRWPANVVLDEDAAALLDEQSGERKSGGYPSAGGQRSHVATYGKPNERGEQRFTSSTGGASRFFYCAKASVREREAGLTPPQGERRANQHPTVKPLSLMRYLATLITPEGGSVLDPFVGSGSTGCAVVPLGYIFTGIDLDPANILIADQRIAYWQAQGGTT